VALLGGAAGIGFAPIFVRLSEIGPSATGFFRIFLALPALWTWGLIEDRPSVGSGASDNGVCGVWLFVLAGVLFAGDLAFWHWSIRMTSIANATFLTNLAPFFVMIGARFIFAEKISAGLMVGLALATAGGTMLVRSSFEFRAEQIWGDLFAVITAFFYGGYLLAVKVLRRNVSTPGILARTGIISCAVLGLVAWLSGENFWPQSGKGWLDLIGLALISHVAGQGLITYALAHLRAGFSAVSLMFQPVVAAALGWILLHEPLTPLQMAGGGVIAAGIAWASLEKQRKQS